MEKYIGTKMIEAEPCPAWKDAGGHKTGDPGYRVRYADGYESWSPKDVFEAAYLPVVVNPELRTAAPSISQQMFGNAFNAKMLGGDGQPWASTKHPVAAKMDQGRKRVPDPDSGTFSNLITDELSVDAITKAQSLAGRYLTPDGLPFLCQMDCVLVSPELEATAKKIFGENSKLRPLRNPADNTNAANPVYEDMTYMVVGGGKDGFGPKQWAICDRTLMKELVNIVYITKPMVMNSDLDNPLIDLYTAYVDFGVGWGDSRQIIFSNPA